MCIAILAFYRKRLMLIVMQALIFILGRQRHMNLFELSVSQGYYLLKCMGGEIMRVGGRRGIS